MRALTICQPWAWAIVHGPKRFENRTWGTDYRGPLLIHAGKSKKWLGGLSGLAEMNLRPGADDLVYSAIVGVCDLVSCLSTERALYHNPHLDPRFAEGPICWTLHNVITLETPVPCSGMMGLWTPSREIAEAVKKEVE